MATFPWELRLDLAIIISMLDAVDAQQQLKTPTLVPQRRKAEQLLHYVHVGVGRQVIRQFCLAAQVEPN